MGGGESDGCIDEIWYVVYFVYNYHHLLLMFLSTGAQNVHSVQDDFELVLDDAIDFVEALTMEGKNVVCLCFCFVGNV
jgi:hypothetical protein